MSGLNKYFITFLTIVFAGLLIYFIVNAGYYPVAVVNGDLVGARQFNREYGVVFRYYAKTLAESKEVDVGSPDFQKELRRAVLQGLIERELIGEGLKEKIGRDFRAAVNRWLSDQNISGEAMEQAAKFVYGLSLADFREMVLIPRAERELLAGRLQQEKTNLEDWLARSLKSANVFVVTPEFYWTDGKLSIR